MSSYLRLNVWVETENRSILLGFEAQNISQQPLHLFDHDRLPLRILLPDGGLQILHGLPESFGSQEISANDIPLTQALEPGDTLEGMVSLRPLFLNSLFHGGAMEREMKGKVEVKMRMGFGLTPIKRTDRTKLSYAQLVEWQQWTEAGISVQFS